MRLAVLHNLHFYNELMVRIRAALDEGTFEEFRRDVQRKIGRAHRKFVKRTCKW